MMVLPGAPCSGLKAGRQLEDPHSQLVLLASPGEDAGDGLRSLQLFGRPGILEAASTHVYSCFCLAFLGCRRQTLTLVNFSKKEFVGRMLGVWRSDRILEE